MLFTAISSRTGTMKLFVFLAIVRTAFASGVCDTQTPAIGVLSLDGYYWPTQPGDISDLRTWCPTAGPDLPSYTCQYGKDPEGGLYFGVIHEIVDGATWGRVQVGNVTAPGLRDGFKRAVKKLLMNKDVCAIVGHAGFFAFYQTFVEQIVDELLGESVQTATSRRLAPISRKPILLGTPLLTVPFSTHGGNHGIPSWDLLKKPNDKVLIVTSNYPVLTRTEVDRTLSRWVDRFDLKESGTKWAKDNSENVFSLGWNNMPGYGIAVVQGALFHNAYNTLNNFQEQMRHALENATSLGINIVGIIMESTEMAVHSNSIRNFTKLPVWDISTLGRCLVKASTTFDATDHRISNQTFNNPVFRDCMMSWYTGNSPRYEKLFGQQPDGKIKHYDDNGLNSTQLETLHCEGGRGGKVSVGRLMSDFPTGGLGQVSTACSETQLTCMCDNCKHKCPGAGNCGETTSPCGVRGEKKEDKACKDANHIVDFDRTTQCGKRGPESNLIPTDNALKCAGSITFFFVLLQALRLA